MLTPNGLGPLEIGDVPSMNAPATDPLVLVTDACVGDGLNGYTGWLWEANYTIPGASAGNDKPFYVDADRDTRALNIVAVYFDNGIKTDRGIHVGSTAAEFHAAYPEAVEWNDGAGLDGATWTVAGDRGTLSFTIWTHADAPGEFVGPIAVSLRPRILANSGMVGVC